MVSWSCSTVEKHATNHASTPMPSKPEVCMVPCARCTDSTVLFLTAPTAFKRPLHTTIAAPLRHADDAQCHNTTRAGIDMIDAPRARPPCAEHDGLLLTDAPSNFACALQAKLSLPSLPWDSERCCAAHLAPPVQLAFRGHPVQGPGGHAMAQKRV